MDRRQQKTRKAIFNAFNLLLEKKHYNNITVQEILDKADIGRSTFYSHFETKDALLRAMCTEIFEHVFSHELNEEMSHDFSSTPDSLEARITHLLYHIKDNRNNIAGILSGESSEVFLRYFKEYILSMFEKYPEYIRKDVPRDFALNHLVGSFAEAVRWWIRTGMNMTPEELAASYLKMTGYDTGE